MREYRYFAAHGRSLEIVNQLFAERRAACEEIAVIVKEVGATNAYGAPRIVGLTFPVGRVPEGWRSYVRGQSKMLMPDKRNKALAPLRKRIEAIKIPGPWELHMRLGFDLCLSGEETNRGAVVMSTWAEVLAGTVVLRVPVDSEGKSGTPPDAEPLKASEYWRLKEAEAEEAAA